VVTITVAALDWVNVGGTLARLGVHDVTSVILRPPRSGERLPLLPVLLLISATRRALTVSGVARFPAGQRVVPSPGPLPCRNHGGSGRLLCVEIQRTCLHDVQAPACPRSLMEKSGRALSRVGAHLGWNPPGKDGAYHSRNSVISRELRGVVISSGTCNRPISEMMGCGLCHGGKYLR
jgi:hypothetical protein